MKKIVLILVAIVILTATMLLSSHKTSNSLNTNSSQSKGTNQVNEKKVENLLTQEKFENKIKSYGVSLYPNIKFKEIKENGDGDIVITYTIPDKSEGSHQKVKDYIAGEFSKLKKNGWDTMPTAHIAMKKQGNNKISIQINTVFYKSSKLHKLYFTLGTVE